MKYIQKIIFVAFIAALSSCEINNLEDYDLFKKEITLSVTPITVTLSQAVNSTATFEIEASSSWTISNSVVFAELSASKGNAGKNTITVTAKLSNTSNSIRKGIITVTCGDKTQDITIIQEPSQSLTVTPTTVTLNQAINSTATFEINASSSWTISNSTVFAGLSAIKGNAGKNTITVTAKSSNTSTTTRKGIITVTCGDKTQDITIIQEPSQSLTVTPSSLSFPYTQESSKTITITASSNWTIKNNTNFVVVSSLSGTAGTKTVTVTTLYNNYAKTFTGDITITCGNITKTINVTQNSKGIYIDGSTVTLINGNVTAGTESETVDFNTFGWSNGTAVTIAKGINCIITFAAGSNTSCPKYYTSTKGVRVYAGNEFTITGTSKAIAKAVITVDVYGGTTYAGQSTATLSCSGNSITYSNAGSTTSQLRAQNIVITYAK